MAADTSTPEAPPHGGPVFPALFHRGQLTVWDYYAGEALRGLLSGPYEHLRQIMVEAGGRNAPNALIVVASELADEAMRAREARQQ